ncbi:hypothetical protein A9308_04470 [Moraxella atlantae]|uniref:Periplasmic repressor CpxP n=1 Tax=Faucicola atlantae TaxID=34059 RepID=A0A1B8QDX9_9GAMM|nr:Spy/CpxP family protein refolding chaperone [Moraxella atlantae]OBX79886.1 hypothetical protein A9308_04470 [Moraxella atlantae]
MKNLSLSLMIGGVLGMSLITSGCATSRAATNAQPVMQPQAHHQPAKMHGDKHGKHDGKRGKMWQDLNLTAAQQAQFDQIKARYDVARKQLKATIAQQEATIAQQKQAGANTATLLALHQQRQNSVEQMMALKKQQRQQMLSVLTPEQQLKFYEQQGKRGWQDGKGKGKDKHNQHRPMRDMPPAPTNTTTLWQAPAQGSNTV